MTRTVLFLFAFSIVLGCSLEERPPYESIENTLPAGGVAIAYDPASSFTNIPEVQEALTEEQKAVFTSSLSWYGTESNHGLEKLSGKTAKQLVDIVNCLKTSDSQQQERCFNG
ncbi:hypothetical protein R50073_18820 [Maricurvus nonylphenolicus]|uniref:hypothetical protein n=1 Tax=Maricurvus nonylphenolicus TaxID=1008307 RepID=UPI0036F37847